nr:hypothetical protein [Endozoicomonas sp.]
MACAWCRRPLSGRCAGLDEVGVKGGWQAGKAPNVDTLFELWSLDWIAAIYLLPGGLASTLIMAFCWGGVTHILTDAMTVFSWMP